MATYYVDNDKTDDSGAGTSWATAKKTIQGAVNLITGALNGENFICLKSDAADPTYSGDVIIEGVRVVGANAKLIIEPRHSDDSTVLWNQAVYNNHTYSPFQSGTSGTWDIKTTRPVTIPAQIEIRNSGTVEIRGVHFDGDSGENAGVVVNLGSIVRVVYSRFEGVSAAAVSQANSALEIENCYFLQNTCSVLARLNSAVNLSGNIYLEDPRFMGIWAIFADAIVVTPWSEAPFLFRTLEIKTTCSRKTFTGIKLEGASALKVWDGLLPGDVDAANIVIRNDFKSLSSKYYGVLLEGPSNLFGAENIEFYTQNAKGETVAMPMAQQVVQS